MAHPNICERRAKVMEMRQSGVKPAKIVNDCALEFNCHPNAIYQDLRNIKSICGIYAIKCNDGFYIGCSNNITRRFHQHKCSLKNNRHSNYRLQNEYSKQPTIELVIIFECEESELLLEEGRIITEYMSKGLKVYNSIPFQYLWLKRCNLHE